jgi:DnaJ-class molecular chaperone
MLNMAKKIIAAVKTAAKKTVVKKVEKKEVVKVVPKVCSVCEGRGLLNPQTLCTGCSGSGTI